MDRHPAHEDVVARLRHDAATHREAARRLRAAIPRELDLVQRLRMRCSVSERVALAQACDREAQEVKG